MKTQKFFNGRFYLIQLIYVGASLVAQMVNNLPAVQETQAQSLGQDDPREKEMAMHSRILAWRIPWTKEPGGLQSMGSQRVGHNWVTKHSHRETNQILETVVDFFLFWSWITFGSYSTFSSLGFFNLGNIITKAPEDLREAAEAYETLYNIKAS